MQSQTLSSSKQDKNRIFNKNRSYKGEKRKRTKYKEQTRSNKSERAQQRVSSPAEPAHVKFGGQAQRHHAVLLNEMHGHLPISTARHYNLSASAQPMRPFADCGSCRHVDVCLFGLAARLFQIVDHVDKQLSV